MAGQIDEQISTIGTYMNKCTRFGLICLFGFSISALRFCEQRLDIFMQQ